MFTNEFDSVIKINVLIPIAHNWHNNKYVIYYLVQSSHSLSCIKVVMLVYLYKHYIFEVLSV